MEVLKYRAKGMSLAEIADILGTTRQNVSAILRAALKKLELAEETVKFYRTLSARLIVKAEKGEDLDDVIGRVYSKADELKIHVKYDGPSLAVRLRALSEGKIVARKVLAPLEIGVTKEGDVFVWELGGLGSRGRKELRKRRQRSLQLEETRGDCRGGESEGGGARVRCQEHSPRRRHSRVER